MAAKDSMGEDGQRACVVAATLAERICSGKILYNTLLKGFYASNIFNSLFTARHVKFGRYLTSSRVCLCTRALCDDFALLNAIIFEQK